MLQTFVFSHQRGLYLQNFLQSVKQTQWPGKVTIVDDGSSDARTLRILREAKESGFEVIRRVHGNDGRWGGLQSSMAHALEIATEPAVLFAQDDLQLVRRVAKHELHRITEIVCDTNNSPFLFPAFHMQSWKASQSEHNFCFNERLGMPVRSAQHPLTGYSEVAIFSAERLREARWDPLPRETRCSQIAESLFGPMVSYPYPFIAFVPFPHIPRRGLLFALRNPRRQSNPASLALMDDYEVARLFERDPSSIPFATQYLRPESGVRSLLVGKKYWAH